MRDQSSIHGNEPVGTVRFQHDTSANVIVLVGGSQIKRKLFESHIEALAYKQCGIVHLTATYGLSVLPKSGLSEGFDGWDPTEDIHKIAERFRITAVVPMIDSVVDKCDAVCVELNLKANSPLSSFRRVDKGFMHVSLASASLPNALSVRVSTTDEALRVWKEVFQERPTVLKPPRSGGCDGVVTCRSEADISEYMHRYHNKYNIERLINSEIIVQKRLEMNAEFVFNSVSDEGQHFFTDVWKSGSKATGSIFTYDTQELVTDLTPYLPVVEYVCKVLTALDVRYGACHTEVAVNLTELGVVIDFCLIEVNPRIAGEIRTDCLTDKTVYDQTYWLLMSIVEPQRFLVEAPRVLGRSRPNTDDNVVAVFLKSPLVRSRLSKEALLEIQKLPSFNRFGRALSFLNDKSHAEREIYASRTNGLLTCPGVVLLVGPTAHSDTKTIRGLETNSLYLHA